MNNSIRAGQELVLKDLEALDKSVSSEDEKVKYLISYATELREIHSYEIYQILNKIYCIRKLSIGNYKLSNLAREKGLPFTEREVYYYMNLRYASPKTIDKINENKIKASTVLFLMNRSKEIRDEFTQDKLIEKITDNEVSLEEISNIPARALLRNLNLVTKDAADREKIVYRNIIAKCNSLRFYMKDNSEYISQKKLEFKLILHGLINELENIDKLAEKKRKRRESNENKR
jgi:hypothetical protein